MPTMRSETWKWVPVCLALAAAPCGPAAAAPPRTWSGSGPAMLDPSGFQRVDPRYGDTDPLRMSLRELSVDLRLTDDFSSVYLIPGTRPGGADDRFARRSGGITAVFPRSIYEATNGGVIPVIPPGTVFYLDGVPAPQPWDLVAQGGDGQGTGRPPQGSVGAGQRVESAIDRSVGALPPGAIQSPADRMPEPAEDHRVFVGVRELLARAAVGT
jgi:hypothetical protein